MNTNGAATTAGDGTASTTVNQTGEYAAQMSYPGFATTTGTPIDVVAGEAVANGVVNLPVTAWYTQPTDISGYGPQWTLKVYFCALGDTEVTCGPSTAGLTLSSANGPTGTFVVDAIDTPTFNNGANGALLPGKSFVALACEVALGSLCSAPVSATVDGNGDPVNGAANPTALVLPPAPTVPAAPAGLAATTTTGSTSVNLTWNAPANDGGSPITGYNVYEGTSAGGESTTPVCTTTASSCPVTGLATGTPYFFDVEAANIAGFSGPSNEARAVAGVNLPAAPTALAATTTASSTSVSLTWAAPANDGGAPITGYNVYVGTSAGRESATPACSTTTTGCPVPGLTTGTTYFFDVEATNTAGSSGPSNEVQIIAGVVPPSAATGLTVTATTVNSASLAWNASANDGGGSVTYEVFEGTSPGGETSTPICTTATFTCPAPNLTAGTTYYFIVVATNAAGPSGPSNEISTTPVSLGLFVPSRAGPSSLPVLLADAAAAPRARGPGV